MSLSVVIKRMSLLKSSDSKQNVQTTMYHDNCQEDCDNIKFSNTDKILFTRIKFLNKCFVTVARSFSLASVNEMSVLKLKF